MPITDRVPFIAEDGADLQVAAERGNVLAQGGEVHVRTPFELGDVALTAPEARCELDLSDPPTGPDVRQTEGVPKCCSSQFGSMLLFRGNQSTPSVGPLHRCHVPHPRAVVAK